MKRRGSMRPPSAVTGRTLRDDYPDIDVLRANLPALDSHTQLARHRDRSALRPDCVPCSVDAQPSGPTGISDSRGMRDGPYAKTNVVIAEPMPGEQDIRDQVLTTLDPQLRELVNRVFEEMLNAAEVGSLLKVDESIHTAISEIYGGYGGLFADDDQRRWKAAERDLSPTLLPSICGAPRKLRHLDAGSLSMTLLLAWRSSMHASHQCARAWRGQPAVLEPSKNSSIRGLGSSIQTPIRDLCASVSHSGSQLGRTERCRRRGRSPRTRSSRANNSPGSEPTACWIR